MKIQANTTLRTRSIADDDCIFSAAVHSRTEKSCIITLMGQTMRTKIYTDREGVEYLRPMKYSMAPFFYANDKLNF
jgi:hypothetical protein